MNLKNLLIIPSTICSILAGLCLGFNFTFTQSIDTSLALFSLFFVVSFVITWFLNDHNDNSKINYQIRNGAIPLVMMIAFHFSYSGIATALFIGLIFNVFKLYNVRYDINNLEITTVK